MELTHISRRSDMHALEHLLRLSYDRNEVRPRRTFGRMAHRVTVDLYEQNFQGANMKLIPANRFPHVTGRSQSFSVAPTHVELVHLTHNVNEAWHHTPGHDAAVQ